eukprot:scaffold126364_cov28-Tisochrysis_lutea.AAC.3
MTVHGICQKAHETCTSKHTSFGVSAVNRQSGRLCRLTTDAEMGLALGGSRMSIARTTSRALRLASNCDRLSNRRLMAGVGGRKRRLRCTRGTPTGARRRNRSAAPATRRLGSVVPSESA